MNYQFKWVPELIFAVGTFLVYVGGQFVLTDSTPANGWADWLTGVSVAGARVTLAAVLPKVLGVLAGLKGAIS